MRFKLVSTLAAFTLLVPFLAQAEGLNYTYVEGAYVNTDFDDFNEDVDGFALRGSFEITDQVFLFAGYSDQSASLFGDDFDTNVLNLGVGYAFPIATRTDLYGKLGYVQAEFDFPGPGDADDDGYLLAFGVRSRVVDQLELEGSLNYVDLSDLGDDTTLGLAARWYFTKQFAAGVEGQFGDDTDTLGINARWEFGN